MPASLSETDLDILHCLRSLGPMSVADLAKQCGVTPTAIRQRLNRLLAEGAISRELSREGRGRPHYAYVLTVKGKQLVGSNYAELAVALWHAVCAIEHTETRRQVWQRAAEEMAKMHLPQVKGRDILERMADVARIMVQKRIPFSVEKGDGEVSVRGASPGNRPDLASEEGQPNVSVMFCPLLVGEACPYPDLSEGDSEICEFERLWLSKLLNTDVKLNRGYRDGSRRCCFQPLAKVTVKTDSQAVFWERGQID